MKERHFSGGMDTDTRAWATAMKLLCRFVIALYPASMRRNFGAEMLTVAEGRFARELALGRRWACTRTCWFFVRDSLRSIPGAYAASLRETIAGGSRNEQPPRSSFRERMFQVLNDVRYALRTLARAKAFTTAALLTLALGIGANTAIFSVVNGIVLRQLPYNDPDELVMIYSAYPDRGWTRFSMSQPDLRSIQDEARSLKAVAGYHSSQLTLPGLGDAEIVRGARVSDGLLEVFSEAPVFGRDIRAEENIPDGPRVVLVGHSFWQERLGGASDVLGKEPSDIWRIV